MESNIDKELRMLKEWHKRYVEEYTFYILVHHPLQVIRTLKELGLVWINAQEPMTFEEYKKLNN